MNSFYTDSAVRKRLVEFLGGDVLEHATSAYITCTDGCAYDPKALHFPSELNWFLDRDLDIARSLADDKYVLLHLDIEYVNFDAPSAAYLNPQRAFALQQPAVNVIETLLLEWGIRPLHLITGQGHHFVWQIARNSDLAARITALSPAPELVPLCQERVPPLLQSRITADMQHTFSGIGLIMDYVAHRVKEVSAPLTDVPVEITAVHVGYDSAGLREMISIDISEYGDPLHTRMIRMPFTNYLKPKLTRLAGIMGMEGDTPALRAIPLHEMDVNGALKVRLIEDDVRELAGRACVAIPEQEAGTLRLLEDYMGSRLRHFHEFYYSTQHDPKETWSEKYGRTPLKKFPPCVRNILENPNDLLLKPAGMQLVSRSLLADGWHPRHIAGLIRSKFEDPSFGWGIDWNDYEAGTRADFYVRTFTGLYATGQDQLVDFNCTSTQEKGFCCHPAEAGCCLESLYQTLSQRQFR